MKFDIVIDSIYRHMHIQFMIMFQWLNFFQISQTISHNIIPYIGIFLFTFVNMEIIHQCTCTLPITIYICILMFPYQYIYGTCLASMLRKQYATVSHEPITNITYTCHNQT